MIKTAISFCLSFIICIFSSSAQQIPNSLLWKISGNGLQKPSYLFGTIHLTDQRLFNFGDSLYNAIEHSQGFAIEVNPDDMMPYMVDVVKQQIKRNLLVKEMMSEKEFKKYSASLSKKLNKPADQITTHDIFREKNKWVSESFKNGRMQTFVDAYLFDIARRQGKWTGGVEDMADQANLAEELVDESDVRQIAVSDDNNSKAGLEIMMQAYINNNLGTIDSIINFSDSASRDAVLVKRNKKMSWRMDSLSHVRTMVFAVGAAHLPGNEGLISLLRKRGFVVEPVFYSKKIKPENYKLAEVKIPWVNVDDPNGYYQVQMPGKPGDIEMYGVITMKMYFDIFNATGYLVTSAATPYGQKGIDSSMSVFAENLFKDKQLKTAKTIVINGIAGKELERTDEEGYKHGYILYKNSVIYIAVSFARSNDARSLQEIKRFLDSYKPVENENTGQASGYTYTDSLSGYKVEFPAKPQPGNELAGNTDKSMQSSMMISIDQKTGAYYIAGANQTAPGYAILNDSSTLARIHENLKEKFTTKTHDTTYVRGEQRVMEYEGMMKNANLHAKMLYVCRGNRWYALVAMYDDSKPNSFVERFFNSFHLTGYQPASWKKLVAADSLFTAWAPGPVKYNSIKDSSANYTYTAYRMYDSTRADTYLAIPEDLGKYYWQKDDSALWNKLAKNIISYNDSLVEKNYTDNNGIKGIEIINIEKGALNATRRRMMLYGDTLYTLSATQHYTNIRDAEVNNYFNSFKFNHPAPPTHIYTSKAAALLEGLLLPDSADRAIARAALTEAPFTKADLGYLHNALLRTYPSSEDEYTSSNKKIADAIVELADSSSLVFARSNYLAVTDGKIKNHLLDIISGYKTSNNYRKMADLVLQSPPALEPEWGFTGNLTDSGSLTAQIFPSLLPLLKDSAMAPALISIAARLVDSGHVPLALVAGEQKNLLAFGAKRYTDLKKDSESYGSGDRPLIHLLGQFNTAASNAMLQKWLLVTDNYLKLECIEALAKNNQPLNPQVLLKLAADKTYRIDLYESLAKAKKEKLFPKQYFTQQAFAQSLIYTMASDDEEPSALTYLSQKIVSFKGKKVRFFFYKVGYGEEEKEYKLACAGPFDADASKLSGNEAIANLYYDEVYSVALQQKQMTAIVKELESWFKWKDEKD